MAIKESKTKINFVIEKELKKELELQAKKEDRTVSNLINKIIKDYINIKKD